MTCIMIYVIDLQKEICFQMFADGAIQDMLCLYYVLGSFGTYCVFFVFLYLAFIACRIVDMRHGTFCSTCTKHSSTLPNCLQLPTYTAKIGMIIN